MTTLNPVFQKLARFLTRGNTLPQTPREPQLVVHHLKVTHVDTFSGVLGVQFPDPSGFIKQGVPFTQSYTPDNPPSVGDTVVAHQYGNGDLRVTGRHVVPTNFITM